MKSIVVFCGANEGYDAVYTETAYALGSILAERNIQLVYGGAKMGLMGAVADGALNNGGRVIGVIPHFLQNREVAHESLTEMILVETMHERKLKMHELSDGIITMPGGFGTMEEMFEMITWAQLGLHQKPTGVLNINGYYDSVKALVNNMVTEGFMKEQTKDILLFSDSIDELLELMDNYDAPEVPQWITKRTT